jgi:hypothetical protein
MMAMASTVYLLCALTSLLCTALLIRRYLASRSRLLFWSCLGFLGLTASNVLLVVDLLIIPEHDLQIHRQLAALMGIAFLIWGFLWDRR